jgi:ATP-dependent Lon protease
MDRMEIITLGGYTEQEKVNIGQRHLVPKAAKNNGLETTGLKFENSALEELIRYYTREAGVRSLEREISSVCRKIARALIKEKTTEATPAVTTKSSKSEKLHKNPSTTSPAAEGQEKAPVQTEVIKLDGISAPPVTDATIRQNLGPRRFSINETASRDEIGVCQGLAYTEVGGDLLITEVSVVTGKGNLKITGKLGDVMQESAQAAFSYVRSRASFLGLEEDFYSKIDIHVHFPEGAIPKDGPSAGITMATALVSALTKRPVSREIAMTGEITLRGRVLPIGGLKEKLLAAHRGGVKKVIIPRENEKDLHEIPKNVLEQLTVVPVDHVDSVLFHALAWEGTDELHGKLKSASELAGMNAAQRSAQGNETIRH